MNVKLWKEDAEGQFPNADSSHYYGGGGGGKGEMAMMMMMQQQQQAEQIRAAQQAKIDADIKENQRVAQEQKDAKEKADKLQKAWGQLTKTLGGASTYGQQQLNQYGGSDKWGLLDQYNSLLNNAKNMIPEDDPNPSSYINPQDLWSQATSSTRGLQRSKLRRDYDELFPSGFDAKALPDEMDDPILNNILGEQTTEAQSSIDRARARGQLNDEAYNTAMKLFGKSQSGARSQLQDLGMGVLQKYRDSLNTEASNFRNRVENWDFGDTVDTVAERANYNSMLNRDRGKLRTDIEAAVGDRDFYNLDALLGKARAQNPNANTGVGTSPLVGAFATTPSTAAVGTQANPATSDITKKQVGVF
jgi:hypothetical protein